MELTGLSKTNKRNIKTIINDVLKPNDKILINNDYGLLIQTIDGGQLVIFQQRNNYTKLAFSTNEEHITFFKYITPTFYENN